MIDLSKTIAPKSDQLNADDLITGPMTIKITKVAGMSDPVQPIAIYFEGDNGKPYKPGKSMRRVLVSLWGRDGASYVGRSLTLYRDEKVQFGGIAVGGIRISHMSHIDKEITMALTASKASRKPFTVQPLREQPAKTSAPTTQNQPNTSANTGGSEPAKTEEKTDFAIILRDKTVYTKDAKQWILDINRLLNRAETVEQIAAFAERNQPQFEILRELGHGETVNELLTDIQTAIEAINNPPTTEGK